MAESTAEDHAEPRIGLGHYRKLAQARDAALALAAKDIPYWIERSGDEWRIFVEIDAAEIASQELASMAEEEANRPARRVAAPLGRINTLPLFVTAWVLGGFFLVQQLRGESWTQAGAAVSTRILGGEWWRAVTALTLHANPGHLIANLLTGLLFAAFLQPLVGAGCAWFLIVLSGLFGNLVNALGYQGTEHVSIGASTSVFGALGLLVGLEVVERLREPHSRNRWSLIVPIGAGLALLAFLGAGDQHDRVDILAHFWGLLCGLPLGAAAGALRAKDRLSLRAQIALGLVALAAPFACWAIAGGF